MDTQKYLVALLSGTFLALAACTPPEEKPPTQAHFTYHYKRPSELGPIPKEIRLALPSIAPEKALEQGEQKARRLADALGVKLDPQKLTRHVDTNNEIMTLRDDGYRFKIYARSGMVKFRDTKLYNRDLDEQKSLNVLDDETALKRANQMLDKLAIHGLVQSEQLLVNSARFSHNKARGNPGRLPNQTGRPKPGPIEVLDTRIFIPRAVDGLGVSGHGVRIAFDKRGEVTGLDLLWRDLEIDKSRQPLPVKLIMEEAIKRFQAELKAPIGAEVDVIANELVYFDPSMRDSVAFLEPGYLFVYLVKVPVEGRDEFRVSKVLHRLIPAVDHGMKQLPSPRKERLQKLRRKMELPRPQKISPVSNKEEKEEGGP
ncbi:MAG: hypothetical protein ACU84H_15695 [Gammaproteobacteria bacterium]